MITVVAAIIENAGRVLIGQRRKGNGFGLKWEFPGGKVKPGESLEAALKRELREELGAECVIGAEVYRTRFQYPEMRDALELVFFSATAAPESVRNVVFEQIRWALPSELPTVDFLPADRELVAKLSRGELGLRPQPDRPRS
jgi:8-oxo-dGTP diphosphatase